MTPIGRVAVPVAAALSIAFFVLHAAVLRPHQYPAGAGLSLSGSLVPGALGEPATVGFARIPDVRAVVGQPLTISSVWPTGAAARAGLRAGMLVTAIEQVTGHPVEVGARLPDDPRAVVDLWGRLYRLSPTGPITLTVVDAPGAPARLVTLARPSVWSLDSPTFDAWFWQYHGPTLAKQLVYTLAALLIVALGARGPAAVLITLAFLFMGATDAGPLMGAEWRLPLLAPLLLAFSWMLMGLSFPIISLALLYFPTRSPMLDRHPWIPWWLATSSGALLLIGAVSASLLAGAAWPAGAVAWLAIRPWVFNTCFAVGLGTNLLLLGFAVQRYIANPNSLERRRIQAVLVTAVPGMAGYAALTLAPLVASSGGADFRWPWQVEVFFQAFVLLSALGMAYAVAVRRALSPRTALRQGIQYALARRTLGILTALPVILLVGALVQQSDQPLSAIIQGRPAFYVGSLLLIAVGLRYRDHAQKWLDRRFFRSHYDAKEILLALSSRVGQETDPRALVSLVLGDVESALHPTSIAVLADNVATYEVIEARHAMPGSLPAASSLVQLLQWSDQPLEVFLDDPGAALARLPASDRAWLQASGAALLVPVLAGTGSERPLIGIIVLGPKRSEESFTSEDRRLLAGIAAQMGLALDLSRLRRQVASTPRAGMTPSVPGQTPQPAASLVDVGQVVDGKYRIDALIGRGGMGAVYRARDLGLDRDVAVKVVRGELVSSTEARERFRREAQLAARLQHPSIVTVFDFGTLADGSAYLVMEYVRGEDLRARIARGTMDWKDTARLLAAVAEGVEAAHRAHILHRDLKPENVLLPASGGPPKVLDFGVAKMMPSADTRGAVTVGATIVGTPAYMAPEQLRGGDIDPRADVYSLAVMAFEMITGHLPFGAGSFVDIAVRQTEDAPVDDIPVPDRLAGVLRRALAFDPGMRPPTAVALATEFRQALGE